MARGFVQPEDLQDPERLQKTAWAVTSVGLEKVVGRTAAGSSCIKKELVVCPDAQLVCALETTPELFIETAN